MVLCLIYTSTLLEKCVWSMEYVMHSLLLLSERNHKPFFESLDASICYILHLLYPHRRHYGLPFESLIHILDIIPHDQLVSFVLGYFFIAGRICINDVTQLCHITRVCLRPLALFGCHVIPFFILDYSSSTILFILFQSSFFRYEIFLVHFHVCLLE